MQPCKIYKIVLCAFHVYAQANVIASAGTWNPRQINTSFIPAQEVSNAIQLCQVFLQHTSYFSTDQRNVNSSSYSLGCVSAIHCWLLVYIVLYALIEVLPRIEYDSGWEVLRKWCPLRSSWEVQLTQGMSMKIVFQISFVAKLLPFDRDSFLMTRTYLPCAIGGSWNGL